MADARVSVPVVVDSRVRLPAGLDPKVVAEIKRAFSHSNPDYYKAKSLGFSTWGKSPKVDTWRAEPDGSLSLPRGGTRRVREALEQHGYYARWIDRRVRKEPVEWPELRNLNPRWYQTAAVDAAMRHEQGVIRMQTGSGKTCAAFVLAGRARQPTLVVMRDRKLLDQWLDRSVSQLGLSPREIGVLQGGKRLQVGKRLTLALQQTLYSKSFPLDEVAPMFGLVIVEECVLPETQILMADGSLRSIEDVRVGDEVAVGGRVIRAMERDYVGEVFDVGEAVLTGEHPVATADGWVVASALRGDDVLWYDPGYEARASSALYDLREEAPEGQSILVVSASRQGRLRCTDREVQAVRRDGGVGSEARTSYAEMLRSRGLEQGSDRADERNAQASGPQAPWVEASAGSHGEDQCGEIDGCFSSCGLAGTEEAVRGSEAAGGAPRSGDEVDRGGKDRPVRRSEVWKREGVDACGDRDARASGSERIRGGGHGPRDRAGEVVQDRPRAQGDEDRAGARRDEPLASASRTGRVEGLLPDVSGLDGAPLPMVSGQRLGLRRDRARVSRRNGIYSGPVFNLETERGVFVAGGVLVHNCQDVAARTCLEVVDAFPAAMRIGISADERRRDKREFVTHDVLGEVIFELDRERLEREGAIVPVVARLVETDFEADWYAGAEPGERDFGKLLDEMTTDESRNAAIVRLVRDLVERKETPVLLFTHRVEHARLLADELLFAAGVRSGLMVGEPGYEGRYDEDKRRLARGEIPIACGTLNAIGRGIDMPAVQAGILATPIASNPQFFNQVRGRVCRASGGKTSGALYVVWDPAVYPRLPRTLRTWNDGLAEVLDDRGEWVRVR